MTRLNIFRTMGLPEVLSNLSDNPYFGAGFGLFGVGAAAAVARKASQAGMIMFRRYYMTTVEVTCKDKSYPWLLQWIAHKGKENIRVSSTRCNLAAIIVACIQNHKLCLVFQGQKKLNI